MNRHLRAAYVALDEIEGSGLHVSALEPAEDLRRALDAMKPRKPIRKELSGPSLKEKREGKRKRHAEETARIREAVFKRADGRCENIGDLPPDAEWGRCIHMPTELHHLAGGIGRRRQKQTVENTRAYCWECHRAAHRASKRATGGGAE